MTELFNSTREFVERSFKNDPVQMRHFDRTVYWLQELKPDADEAFLIAALGHDLERAFRDKDEDDKHKAAKGFKDPEFLKYHQEKSAEILADFLKKEGAAKAFIKRVIHLVSRHEVGGDADQNLLKDADSLSFLENNAERFLERLDKVGYDKIKEKFDWMYERITDPRAKEIGKPFYEQMLRQLDSAKGPES